MVSKDIGQNTVSVPGTQLNYQATLQLGHEDPGVFHGHEIRSKHSLAWFF